MIAPAWNEQICWFLDVNIYNSVTLEATYSSTLENLTSLAMLTNVKKSNDKVWSLEVLYKC